MTTLLAPATMCVHAFPPSQAPEVTKIPSRRPPSDPCRIPGCTQKTTEGKPFCYDHLHYNRHAAEVLAEIKRREEELERAAKRGKQAVDLDGTRAQDILTALGVHHVLSPEKLWQVAFQDLEDEMEEVVAELAQAYVEALVASGLVEVIVLPSRRGGFITVFQLSKRGMEMMRERMGEET